MDNDKRLYYTYITRSIILDNTRPKIKIVCIVTGTYNTSWHDFLVALAMNLRLTTRERARHGRCLATNYYAICSAFSHARDYPLKSIARASINLIHTARRNFHLTFVYINLYFYPSSIFLFFF